MAVYCRFEECGMIVRSRKGIEGKKGELLLGAHVSIAGGINRSAERAGDIGCRAFQIFTKNSNQWREKEITKKEAQEFRELVASAGFSHVISHDSYLINVASPDEALQKRSVNALSREMERANRLGLDFVVMHPGAHKGAGVDEGLKRVSESLEEVLAGTPDDGTCLLLETTAGQGSSLGSRFEELSELIGNLGADGRVGVCLDTCHIFAAGYDIRNRDSFESTMEEFDRVIGVERLRMLHLNDTLKEFGSRVDRHFHIGKGNIGLEGFRLIVNDERFRSLPMIIETPKGEDDRLDRENLALLRKLAAS
jgi:deoxyribonuclease-4